MYVSARSDYAIRAMLAAAYHGIASELGNVWLAAHSAIEEVVNHTTLADLLAPHLHAQDAGAAR